MNWVFTRPGVISFAQDEPFCHIFPIRRGELESVEPQMRKLSEEPELSRQYQAWNKSRSQFNAELGRPGSQAQSERWQKTYYRGLDPDGQVRPEGAHRTFAAFCRAGEFVHLMARCH